MPDEHRQHRARYDALRAAGQGEAARRLPPATDRGQALAADAVLHREWLPGGCYWSTRLARGDALRIVNPGGMSAVALIAWCADGPSERINLVDTMKVQWSTTLCKGRVVYTDQGRVALSVIEDSCGAHDALLGPTTPASMARVLGAGAWRNSRDNFCTAAARFGLSRRDVPPCLSLFAPVGVDGDGRFVWHAERRAAGDFVDLRAELDLWLVLSNAGHPLDPDLVAVPAPVELLRHRPAVGADDPCRHGSAEAERAFAFTERQAAWGSRA